MSRRLAILIAVENYHDTRIPSVPYAEADAMGFAEALELGGALEKLPLVNAAATHTSILSKVKQNVNTLTEDDFLFLFYAGHGFSKNEHSFITCYDTDQNDLAGTSIKIKSLLDLCASSACKRIALFLDACESGIAQLPEVRGIYSTMSDAELKQFFEGAEYRACFASCKASESSYSASVLRHGVWTYNVINALEGNAEMAMEKGRYITAVSLQNYLKQEVPRTLRSVFSEPTMQTPWFYGSQASDFIVSDLYDAIQQRNAVKPGYEQVTSVFLSCYEDVRINSLSGFRKKSGHRVPDEINEATRRFVRNISEAEVREEIDEIYRHIREVMDYKRKDCRAEYGRIITPHFDYVVEVEQSPGDPAMARVVQRLSNISPEIVGHEGFNEVFDDRFNAITLPVAREINIEKLIDRLEDHDLDNIDVDYPADCSYVKMSFENFPPRIVVKPDGLTVRTPQATSPLGLMEALLEVQRRLAGSPVIKAIEKTARV